MNKNLYWIIGVISIIVPLLVMFMFYNAGENKVLVGFDIYILPKINAMINGSVTVLLILALYMVKNRKYNTHRLCMLLALGLSGVFLILYVAYHSQAPETKYLGEGFTKYVYYFTLLSHILLSFTVIPLAILSAIYGLQLRNEKHKKIVKWAYPVWLYVSITGVIVFLFISPYYPS